MQVKIDTKEKFYVITLIGQNFTANIAAELTQTATILLQQQIKNVVLKLTDIQSVEDAAANELARLQQIFYEHDASFIICEIQSAVKDELEELDLLEMLNIIPTESEATDIVHMEDIERELLDHMEDE